MVGSNLKISCLTYRDLFRRLPEMFLDDSTKISVAKVLISVMVVLISALVSFYLAFAFCEFSITRKIPALPQGLAWVITSLVGGISALYGFNKLSAVTPFLGGDKKECKREGE